MAARLSRSLPQVNRQVFTRLSSRAIPIANARHAGLAHRNTWNLAPRNRVLQAGTRYAHTDAGSANSGPAMLDATGFKGSIVSEKHWKNQGLPVGMVLSLRRYHIANQFSGCLDRTASDFTFHGIYHPGCLTERKKDRFGFA